MTAHMRGPVWQRHANGLTAIYQLPIGDYDISYNPDDDRFYVTRRDDETTMGTFMANDHGLDNARQLARRLMKRG